MRKRTMVSMRPLEAFYHAGLVFDEFPVYWLGFWLFWFRLCLLCFCLDKGDLRLQVCDSKRLLCVLTRQ